MGRTNTTSTNRLESESAIGRSIKMAPPRLDQFPSELIDAIASFLDEEDLLTIRFVCHALRSGSESLFGRTYFTSRTTSLDLDDLHSLSEVSRHPKFSGHTKELGIDIELLARSSSPCPLDIFERLIGSAEHKIFRDPHNKPLQDYRNELRKISESQKFADRVGLQTAVLTLILRNLPALTDIQMYRGVNASFHKKVAKGWYHSGMHKLAANVPLALSKMFDYTSGVDKVLTAISVSMKPLISLAIDSFDPGSSAVPDHLPTALNYSLNSVKFLDLWLTDRTIHTEGEEVARLLSYLVAMPKLEHLQLRYGGLGGFAIERIGARILWPNLTQLELHDFMCTEEDFHNFIRKHANTLRHIEFGNCLLQPGNWRPIFFSILNAGRAQVLEVWGCQPFSYHDSEQWVEFEAEGTPAEVSAELSAFLEELPQF